MGWACAPRTQRVYFESFSAWLRAPLDGRAALNLTCGDDDRSWFASLGGGNNHETAGTPDSASVTRSSRRRCSTFGPRPSWPTGWERFPNRERSGGCDTARDRSIGQTNHTHLALPTNPYDPWPPRVRRADLGSPRRLGRPVGHLAAPGAATSSGIGWLSQSSTKRQSLYSGPSPPPPFWRRSSPPPLHAPYLYEALGIHKSRLLFFRA
ncbi:hypothetical protein LX36DRAFT_660250 [Colletotrichum falcatum]|nr:hypothetical protein LX36DRAFT_660250 [Colletotrichum falcatum]